VLRGRRTLGALLVAAFLTLMLGPSASLAAFPGANGKIAFGEYANGSKIYAVNADGTGRTLLTGGTDPAWSADGRKIAYINGANHLATMNADGSGQVDLGVGPNLSGTDVYVTLENPAWSPDDEQIAFDENIEVSDGNVWTELDVVNADGSGRHVPFGPGGNTSSGPDPSWSPDGQWIVFAEYCGGPNDVDIHICKIRPDGTDLTWITGTRDPSSPDWSPDGTEIVFGDAGSIAKVHSDGTGYEVVRAGGLSSFSSAPAWSPDGNRIAFTLNEPYYGPANVYVMNSDGTGATNLTSGSGPSWQPIPQSYVRPRGATPLRVSLVPASNQCTSPNNAHGAPLSFSSCSPPVQSSPNLTVGTPDANGSSANSNGNVRLDAVAGDVKLAASIIDVRCYWGSPAAFCASPNQQPANDYSGELQARLSVRITDRNNTPNPGGPGPGTVEDTTIPFTIPCTTTGPSNFIGSTCAVSTTVDSLMPGAVVAGMRSIWQLDKVEVYDGGSDGVASTAPNALFETQGVFIP
jgi:Tol biopolymer transport system component